MLPGSMDAKEIIMMRWLQLRARVRGRRGVVMVEYALLLVAVGIPTIVGLGLGGARMLTGYVQTRNAILQPNP